MGKKETKPQRLLKPLQQKPTCQRNKKSTMKALLITAIASLALLTINCMESKSNRDGSEIGAIFSKGELGPAENFIGKAWNIGLVANDTVYNTVVGNVYFEPGARSNWHTHPSGQILIHNRWYGLSPNKRSTKTNHQER
jgi:hypothetical protein